MPAKAEVNMNELADAAIKKAKGDIDAAQQFLMESARKHKAEMEAFAFKGMREALLTRTRVQRDYVLSHIPDQVSQTKSNGRDIAATANYYYKAAMDYSLSRSGGKRIADAVHSEIVREADMHAAFEAGNGHKKRWLLTIADRLKADDSNRVKQVFDEETLKAAWDSAAK